VRRLIVVHLVPNSLNPKEQTNFSWVRANCDPWDQRSRFLGPHGSCAGDSSSDDGFGPSEQQIVVFTESSTYAVRQHEAAWDARATSHRRAARTEFLKIAEAAIEFVQVLAIRTMNDVKQRAAKDMSAASELVRAWLPTWIALKYSSAECAGSLKTSSQ